MASKGYSSYSNVKKRKKATASSIKSYATKSGYTGTVTKRKTTRYRKKRRSQNLKTVVKRIQKKAAIEKAMNTSSVFDLNTGSGTITHSPNENGNLTLNFGNRSQIENVLDKMITIDSATAKTPSGITHNRGYMISTQLGCSFANNSGLPVKYCVYEVTPRHDQAVGNTPVLDFLTYITDEGVGVSGSNRLSISLEPTDFASWRQNYKIEKTSRGFLAPGQQIDYEMPVKQFLYNPNAEDTSGNTYIAYRTRFFWLRILGTVSFDGGTPANVGFGDSKVDYTHWTKYKFSYPDAANGHYLYVADTLPTIAADAPSQRGPSTDVNNKTEP